MSSRTDSSFGSLSERTSRSRPRHVTVDGRHAGVLIAWHRTPHGWEADVGYVTGEKLVMERLPADRVAPYEPDAPGPSTRAPAPCDSRPGASDPAPLL